MIERIVVERYARVLLEIAQEKGKNEEVFADIKSFTNLIDQDKIFSNFLFSPIVGTGEKERIMNRLFKEKIEPSLFNFIMLLIRKRRIHFLLFIQEMYEEFYYEEENRISVTAVTAVVLDATLEDALNAKLAAVCGKGIKIKREINPSILGGLIIKTRSKYLDGSVKRQLEEMCGKLKTTKL